MSATNRTDLARDVFKAFAAGDRERIESLLAPGLRFHSPADPDLDQLTPREQEVLRLIARGYAYKEIATRLHLSVKTIETHVSAVLRKLQLSNRHQLTAWANERRLV